MPLKHFSKSFGELDMDFTDKYVSLYYLAELIKKTKVITH